MVIVLLMGCCEERIKVDHKVVEKFHTQNRDGGSVYYKLLFDNGVTKEVNAAEYVRCNIGDEWTFTECKGYNY